jgi:hypothetical protein
MEPEEKQQSPNPPNSDVIEVCELLDDQKELLWEVYHAATEPPGKVMKKADLACFLLVHALHIHQMSKSALILMTNGNPYSVALLARSALESMFNLVASMKDRDFGPQRMAFELEEVARKLRFLLEKHFWHASRLPTPEDCEREAKRIRTTYSALPPSKGDRHRIEKTERIAATAGLSPFYDDDYRQLSLAVHSNQAGILNSASGFLVRKGMLALCTSTHLASQVICAMFRLKSHSLALKTHHARLEVFINKADFLPQARKSPQSPASTGAAKRGPQFKT